MCETFRLKEKSLLEAYEVTKYVVTKLEQDFYSRPVCVLGVRVDQAILVRVLALLVSGLFASLRLILN